MHGSSLVTFKLYLVILTQGTYQLANMDFDLIIDAMDNILESLDSIQSELEVRLRLL